MKLVDTSVVIDIDRGNAGDRVITLDDEGRHAIFKQRENPAFRPGVNRVSSVVFSMGTAGLDIPLSLRQATT